MKKIIGLTVAVATFAGFLVGCTNPALPSAVGEKLVYSLNSLQNTVRKLDTVDNNYLKNPDIAPVINDANTISMQTPRPSRVESTSASVTIVSDLSNAFLQPIVLTVGLPNDMVETNRVENIETDILKTNTQQDALNNDEMQVTNVDNLNENLNDTSFNQVVTPRDEQINDTTNVIFDDTNTVDSQNNNMYDVNYNDDVTVNDTNDTLYRENHIPTNNENLTDTTNLNDNYSNIIDEEKEQNLNDLNNNVVDNNDMNQNTYTYEPRFASDNTIQNDTTHLDNYMTKVQNLYTMTNDAIVANNTLDEVKDNLNNFIDELRVLAKELKEGAFVPSEQQIQAINNYINDLRTTIARIRGTNGELNNEINKINNYDKNGMTTSIDVLNSNYLRIINHIDVRITYLKTALNTLEHVKALLLEAQEYDRMERINTQNNVQYAENYIDYEKENYNNVNDINKEQGVVENDVIDSENYINENNNYYHYNDTTNRDVNLAQDNNTNLTNPVLNNRRNYLNTQNDYQNYNRYSNIDSYNRVNRRQVNSDHAFYNRLRNTDTYRVPKTNYNVNRDGDINNVVENQNNVNDVNNVTNNNDVINDTNNQLNNDFINGTVMPNNIPNNNGVINNGIANNGVVFNQNNNNDINTPNGTFQNGIIRQNNLNQGVNNGVNGNMSGYNGSTNHPSSVDSRGRNRNINTYGFNTLVDIINQGTVNNGINTLNATANPETFEYTEQQNSDKPNMVNVPVFKLIETEIDAPMTNENINQKIINNALA